TIAIGNGNGYVGLGQASGQNGRAANVKATRKAKLNIQRVRRGCGSWECTCGEPHTVPFKVKGKCASVSVELIPAPRGLGMKTGPTAKKILELAGISDIWIKTTGNTRSSPNFGKAVIDALNKTNTMKGSLTATGSLPPQPVIEEPVKETALAEDLNIESVEVKVEDAKKEVATKEAKPVEVKIKDAKKKAVTKEAKAKPVEEKPKEKEKVGESKNE
ncbi:MAG: hypothetical protein GOV15_04775, partial [Candidatus Diapherotrites archaeon]|nr:hypothetical protein [Candidatus Diapherotrites archaeon]